MISYVLPTRDRPELLAQTLDAIASLGDHAEVGGAEVVIADNASTIPPVPPACLPSGVCVRMVRMERNIAAAARNAAVQASDSTSEWVIMLDDDSYPMDLGLSCALRDAAPDVQAIGAEILLPSAQGSPPRHESGGLPEVFIGCGVAIRRRAFLEAGGYDPTFDYYAEEYDLAARLMLRGGRIGFDRRFRIMHHKTASGRDMNRILRRLVRNNAWVMRRYAPLGESRRVLRETITRYAGIARKEKALAGYLQGLGETAWSLLRQRRSPMPSVLWDRFTGLAAARDALRSAHDAAPLGRVAIVHEGKNAWAVDRALTELHCERAASPAAADTLIIGTMSPGPMLDALHAASTEFPGRRIVPPFVGCRSESLAAALAA